MKRYDVIDLVRENQTVHGVYETPEESLHRVFCEVRSVTRSEVYQALAVGVNASIVFVLSLAEDYNGEKECVYKNVRYRIIRTYMSDDGIELTCEVQNG